ncbi:hypothetical protein [Microbacterium allomyrinae]|uniref:Uncharacterized protein n=1 Tax=Microbacterium allomyrinae TaxID=2830666 RepID=A0A9X1LVY5_9MICO|nr:hypothetical protein [Microbacterium allomyrinae]MCC2032450.1 hypothetical protein [Microbacterium allomyrinae]
MSTTTITYDGGPTLSPLKALVSSYSAEAESRTVAHSILDGDDVYTLRPAGADVLTLELLFADEIGARDCHRAHKLPAEFTIADDTRELLNLRYVVTGRIRVHLDPETRRRWLCIVPITEVS